ncbi:cyclic nucleotide-binding domain-containing protein [Azospirillum thermophilum]|uniref:cAMP-binding protein n=1 Tax=Azospirillum thermophilum TaxID=2202148 RepID=A0A2S2CWZ0_9PROT|nr:cyclic nucleotide-binding domain-containing protein [Azospirillum thermophilum]AWK88935.1 cAMP-binding protein [Azospirillum thermophilum]
MPASRAAPVVRIPAGLVLVHQGRHGDRAWLVEEGELEVLLERPDGLKRIGTLGPNSIVGEMALIDDGVRSASVRAVTDVHARELTREAFRAQLEKCPPLARYLLESLIAAIRRSYGLPQPERQEGGPEFNTATSFQTVVERRSFRPGHVFFRQDDAATAAYLIQSGRVAIRRDDGTGSRDLGLLGPGRIFGELALLTDRPRAATATAEEQTVCEIIRKESFASAMAAMPKILQALARHYVEQLAAPR